MSRANFILNEEAKAAAVAKCDQIIALLEDVPNKFMKAYILFELIQSFKDVSGIDVFKTFKVEVDEGALDK